MQSSGEHNTQMVEKISHKSVVSIPPVLLKFLFVGIEPVFNFYNLFKFEPMHLFSLGISKILKVCAISMLTDESRSPTSILYATGKSKLFKAIRRLVMGQLNGFLRKVKLRSPRFVFGLDVFKKKTGAV